jgi:hypothetical protein
MGETVLLFFDVENDIKTRRYNSAVPGGGVMD